MLCYDPGFCWFVVISKLPFISWYFSNGFFLFSCVNNRYSEVIVFSLSLFLACVRSVSVVKLKRMTFRTNKMYETNASLPTWDTNAIKKKLCNFVLF